MRLSLLGPSTHGPGGSVGAAKSDDLGIQRAEQFARDHPAIVHFGRVGWIAKGLVYGLTGVLALLIGLHAATGSSESQDDEASQVGAIARLAETSFGGLLLVTVAAGLVVYSAWRLLSVFLPADNDLYAWLTRAGYLVSAAMYVALAWTAVVFVRSPGGQAESEDSRIESFTTDVMEMRWGRQAVFVIGVALVMIAAAFVWKGISASFRSQLLPNGVGPISHEALVILGRVGWLGRAGMMSLIGFFLARAAWRFDPNDAQGLDGSLRKATSSGPGTWLVLAVGVGLLVYGVFCAVSAPRQRLVGADS